MKTFGSYHKDRNAHIFAGEPLTIHTDFYNCFLQKAVEELSQYIDVRSILINSAQETAYTQFKKYFESKPNLELAERKELVEAYYSYCGFGKIDVSHVQAKGGYVETTSEHYSLAWKRIYGEAVGTDGVCYFTMGFLCGATEAIYDIALGTFDAKQIRCLTKGDESLRIDVFRGLRKKLKESVGEGVSQSFESQPSNSETSVNYTEVMDALLSNDLAGDEKTGLIEAYGGLVTRHYANYYNLISVRILMGLEKKYKRDGVLKAKSVMIKSAQTSAMHLLSNLVSSSEWKKHIAPSVRTTDDQLHGILAFINTLGWGKWEVERLNPEVKTSLNITASSESNAFLKMVGKTKAPICFFLEGMVSGIMNMVLYNKLAAKMKLDDDVFDAIFKSDNRYVVTEARTRMTGEETDHFIVEKKQ
jgi:predicted hydrocarbon binding protein